MASNLGKDKVAMVQAELRWPQTQRKLMTRAVKPALLKSLLIEESAQSRGSVYWLYHHW